MTNPQRPIVLSLCDFTGTWAKPWLDTHDVVLVDPKHGQADPNGNYGGHSIKGAERKAGYVLPTDTEGLYVYGGTVRDIYGHLQYCGWRPRIDVILAAPPCTDFAGSGARWWAEKDKDGRTEASIRIVQDCLDVIEKVSPRVWVIENPVGRLPRLVPFLQEYGPKYFHPHEYAKGHPSEAYTKRTGLWGRFTMPPKGGQGLPPKMYTKTRKDGSIVRGSWMWATLGGKSERTKALRSATPKGFSEAFHNANQR